MLKYPSPTKVLAAALIFLSLSAPLKAATEIGQAAPALVVQELNGTAFDLAAFKGKVVVLHFWATWCAPCKEEMPVLDRFYQKSAHDKIAMIAVSIDKARHRDDVMGAMKEFHFPAALLNDAKENGFGTPNSMPVTYIIDQKGVIATTFTPDETLLNDKILEDATAKLLRP